MASCPVARPRSKIPGYRLAAATTTGRNGLPEFSRSQPEGTGATSLAEVDTSPTPATRPAKNSGSRPAKVSSDIPPIEWPMITTGPLGAAVAITEARSEAR